MSTTPDVYMLATPGIFDTIMGDTVGVLWRAGTGTVDPWTKNEIVANATQSNIQTGMDPTTAAQQAQSDVTDTLQSFSLGGGDKTGADPSQATLALPSGQSLLDTWKSMTNDDGSGCSITNLAGCYPSWLPYVVIAGGVLLILWVLRPYVELAEG